MDEGYLVTKSLGFANWGGGRRERGVTPSRFGRQKRLGEKGVSVPIDEKAKPVILQKGTVIKRGIAVELVLKKKGRKKGKNLKLRKI